MTITETQRQEIYNLVWQKAEYKETFDEVYDHVLTALEHYPQTNEKFENVVTQIVKDDFGDILDVEFKRVRMVRRQISMRFWQYMRGYFKFPLIMFTILAGLLGLYVAEYIPRNITYITVIAATAVPVIVIGLHCLKKGEFYPTTVASIGFLMSFGFKTTYHTFEKISWICTIFMIALILLKVIYSKRFVKASVKDRITADLSFVGVGLLCIFILLPMLILGDRQFNYIKQAHTAMVAIMLICHVVYCMSFLKLYRDEFKMQMVS